MDKIIEFLTNYWYIAVAVVVLLLVIIIAIAVGSKKKKVSKDNCGNECGKIDCKCNSENNHKDEVEFVEVAKPQVEEAVEKQQAVPVVEKQKEAVPVVEKQKEAVPVIEKQKEVAPAKEKQKEVAAEVAPKEKNNVASKTVQEKNIVEEVSVQEKNVSDADEANEPKKTVTKGKWQIIVQGDDEYVSNLIANNGEVMLTSEVYTTFDGAMKGIETIKKNITAGNFDYCCDKNSNWYYKLKTSTNRLLCVGEVYPSKQACNNSIESVKKFAQTARKEENVIERFNVKKYVPTGEIEEVKGNSKGKWAFANVEGLHFVQLIASNGEILLTSESYSTLASAKAAMANIKKNAIEFNFIIDTDKTGKTYYKLRNAQKSVLCVGAAYETQQACINSIESVIRFCKSAKVEAIN